MGMNNLSELPRFEPSEQERAQRRAEEEARKRAEEIRRKRVLENFRKTLVLPDEDDRKSPSNFIKREFEPKELTSDKTNNDYIAKNLFEAVQDSSYQQLLIYLGPRILISQKHHQKHSNDRFKKWLSVTKRADFFNEAKHALTWLARQRYYSQYWQEKQGKDKVPGFAYHDIANLAAEDYKKTLLSSQARPLHDFFDEEAQTLFLQGYEPHRLTEEDKRILKNQLHRQLQAHTSLYKSDFLSNFYTAEQQDSQEYIEMRPLNDTAHSSTSVVLRTTLAYSAQWQQQYQLVALAHKKPLASEVNRWLLEIDSIINYKTDMAEIADAIDKLAAQYNAEAAALQREQTTMDEKYMASIEGIKRRYAVHAKAWPLRVSGEEVTRILESSIGEVPLDSEELLFGEDEENDRNNRKGNNAGNGKIKNTLLHVAMKKYVEAQTPDEKSTSLQIVEELIRRGLSPYVRNSAEHKETAFSYGRKGGIPSWRLLAVTFSNMEIYSPLTNAVRAVLRNYCELMVDLESSRVFSAAYSVVNFFNARLTIDRLCIAEIEEMGEALYRASLTFKETELVTLIDQKVREALRPDARGNPTRRSRLYEELRWVLEATEKGLLPYFSTERVKSLLGSSAVEASPAETPSAEEASSAVINMGI